MTAPQAPYPAPSAPPLPPPQKPPWSTAPHAASGPYGGGPTLLERLAAGRPTNFPSVGVWLKAGIFRNWRGAVTALAAAWFYVPAAVLYAVSLALMLGLLALFYSAFGSLVGSDVPGTLDDLPVVGDALGNLVLRSGGVMLTMVAVVVGAVLGLVIGFALVFAGPFEQGVVQGLSTLLGIIIGGTLVGLAYTLYRVACEGRILRVMGVRRLSRREADLLLPIVRDCAARLGLVNHPPLLIDDRREPNAVAYTRHIVVNQGLLEEFNYDREAIAAIVCHELVHWRNGDPISATFVRGVALPLYLVQAGAGWLLQRTTGSILRFAVWSVFWPVFVTVKYMVMPMQAADSRQAEYRADQGAVLAGHRTGMRRVLTRFRQSFEGGRNGWDAAVCATHPPNELRLERLEEPGVRYCLPDEEAPPLPLPVALVREG